MSLGANWSGQRLPASRRDEGLCGPKETWHLSALAQWTALAAGCGGGAPKASWPEHSFPLLPHPNPTYAKEPSSWPGEGSQAGNPGPSLSQTGPRRAWHASNIKQQIQSGR